MRSAQVNAADYGAPQSRVRLIYIAALAGWTLPDIPLPTHLSPTPLLGTHKETYGIATPPAKPYKAHAMVTIRDAIEDLPAFDW